MIGGKLFFFISIEKVVQVFEVMEVAVGGVGGS